jgi:hypothetical protein
MLIKHKIHFLLRLHPSRERSTVISVIILFFCVGLGLRAPGFQLTKQVLYVSHTSSPFCSGYFGDGFSRTICLSYLQATNLPISASQVVRITGVSHQHQVIKLIFDAETELVKIARGCHS